jgi:hypothetical protein
MRNPISILTVIALSLGGLSMSGCDRNDGGKTNTTSTGTTAPQNDMGGTMTGAGTTQPSGMPGQMMDGAGSSGSTTQPASRSTLGDGGTSSSPANNAGR